jgi:hypothetical protein
MSKTKFASQVSFPIITRLFTHILWAERDSRKRSAPSIGAPASKRAKTAPAKKGRTSKGTVRARPGLRDYPKKTRELLELAMKHFRALIATQHAFPEPGDADEWAQECYKEACKGKKRAPIFEEHFADMVRFSFTFCCGNTHHP